MEDIYDAIFEKALLELEQVNKDIKRCSLCLRSFAATGATGTGYPLADVFLLKDGPSKDEAEQGVAFQGRYAEAFEAVFTSLKLSSSLAFGTNAVKCVVNREDMSTAARRCRPFLNLELSIVRPKLIVSLGKVSFMALRNLNESLLKEKAYQPGDVLAWAPGTSLLVTHGLDKALQKESLKRELWLHLKMIPGILSN